MKKHRHEQAMWIILGGYAFWCYQCGAYRCAKVRKPNISIPVGRWQKPSGIGGKNPALTHVDKKS